ncbi:MAG: phosphoglycerate dehydrogenase [Candidatus Eremiobacteraeota bacterium]|nr:phosphoglycerate dehydrogenase [Candidatus Eremiobacteraeota bacterium]MBC5803986.1 phosphoglycerate dehydrogenase [Candidatus Eremiobacteraeota bacterium]MBC5821925.1 phosphoglycerate dehydrogenase [Candidatus Eremiobacteraeota bacterium]
MSSRSSARVVVAEPFSDSGIDVLRRAGIEIVSVVGRPLEALQAALADAHALIVRSETPVDRALLAHAPNLAVVARAGVGVDAIDVAAATEAGIVVLNTPAANTLAATEQTFALLLSLVRHIPDAAASLRAGRWERKPFIGSELYGKVLGIVGLGRIGGAVAARAAAFGMTLLAADPFLPRVRAEALGAELLDLDDLLARADIVTLHVPLNAQTRGLIDAARLALMPAHAVLVNCARGGVVDEPALYEALEEGRLRGAALDVVASEPPAPGSIGARLQRHPKVIATPHLGGSTVEALERIALELAHDVVSVLLGGPAAAAVNAPVAAGADAALLRPFVELAYRLGKLYAQVAHERALPPLVLVMQGRIAAFDGEPVVTAFLSGLLQTTTSRRVSIVNARAIAQELGLTIELRSDDRTSGAFAATLRVTGGATSLAGTSVRGHPRIIAVDGFEVDMLLQGSLLATRHRDVPGMVGRVGTILGEDAVNISTMQVARTDAGGDALMILGIDRRAGPETIERIRAIPGVGSVRAFEA